MSLLDEFQATQTSMPGPRCGIAVLLDSLDPATAAELVDLLAVDSQHVAMARFITAKWPDHPVKGGTISRHRRGECSCAAR